METTIMPFGAPAWERRRQILREIIASRPRPSQGLAHDFRDVLYLVPNERTVRTLKALFLDVLQSERGIRACIPPEITALNGFIVRRAKSASSLPVIDDTTKSLLLEGLCRKAAHEGVHGIPPEVLGPSLAPMLSEALDALYKHSVDDRAVRTIARDSLPLTLLLKVKRGYEKRLDQHRLADLHYPKVYAPIPGEFSNYKSVVLDGFYDAEPSELSVLRALATAADCKFILEAPGIVEETSREGMPYQGASRLVEALGGGLDSATEDADSRLAEVISGTVFGGMPLHESESKIKGMSGFSRDISIVTAPNPVEEVCFAASSIKQAYMDGALDLNRVLVLSQDMDSYLPMLEEAFRDAGIPYHLSQGYPLMQSPVVTALMDILSLPVDNYSYRGMRKVFLSPFIALHEEGNRLDALEAFARSEGITSGRRRWLEGLEGETSVDAVTAGPRIGKLFSLMGPFETRVRALSGWTRAALELLGSSGITDSVNSLRPTRSDLFNAYTRLCGALERLGLASSMLGEPMDLPGFLYVLRKDLSGERYRPSSTDVLSGVRVLGALEALSEPFDVIYACGLTENSLPRARRPDLFFSPETAARLGLPAGDLARTRDARLFLGLMLAAPRVFLCYPGSTDGSPASPSPYIRALEPFLRAGAVKRLEGKTVCRTMSPGKANGPGEFMRALALGASLAGIKAGPEIAGALDCLPEGTPGLDRARHILSRAPLRLPPRPPEKREFRVTELDEYNVCHYRYYQGRVAGSAPAEEPDDDIAPHKAGSLVHEILSDFYKSGKPVTASNMDEALARLVSLANKNFEKLPDTTSNRIVRRRFIEFIAPAFIEAEAEFSGTGYSVCKTEMPVEIEVDDPEAGHFVITGKIDRLELDREGNFNVVDYKTGSYPGSGMPVKDMFQLPLYAHMLREKHGRPASLVYYNLKQGAMRDVAAYDSETASKALLKNKPRRKLSPEEMGDLISGSYKAAVDAVRGILAGKFEPTCKNPYICQRCIFVAVCVKGKRVEDEGAGEGPEGGGDGED